jgi:replicative DNA helicase
MTELQPYPSAILAEKSVVSSCLQSERLYRQAKAEGIDLDAFHHPQTRIVFDEIERMTRDDNGEIDLPTLVHKLQDGGNLERAGGASEVYSIFGFAPHPSGWTQWVEMLREMKARRLAMRAAQKLSEAVDSAEAIDETKRALESLTRAVSGARRAVSAKDAANAFIQRLKADRENGDLPGASTGITLIDAVSGGMRPGEFWVIGGRPSRGKSVLMLQVASEFIDRGEAVAVFSLEMMAHEIIGRLVSVLGRVDYGSITQPRQSTKHELTMMQSAIAKLADSNLWIDASPGQNLDTIQNESQRIKDLNGSLSLIVVDYLQLIRGGRNRNETREEEIARVSGGLKQLAKAMGCPVISASQLNEQGQTRESRAIEQDADALLFIAEDGVKVGKLRNGQRDQTLPLILEGKYQKFTEIRP